MDIKICVLHIFLIPEGKCIEYVTIAWWWLIIVDDDNGGYGGDDDVEDGGGSGGGGGVDGGINQSWCSQSHLKIKKPCRIEPYAQQNQNRPANDTIPKWKVVFQRPFFWDYVNCLVFTSHSSFIKPKNTCMGLFWACMHKSW